MSLFLSKHLYFCFKGGSWPFRLPKLTSSLNLVTFIPASAITIKIMAAKNVPAVALFFISSQPDGAIWLVSNAVA
jgi:hypothetical protein